MSSCEDFQKFIEIVAHRTSKIIFLQVMTLSHSAESTFLIIRILKRENGSKRILTLFMNDIKKL